jgi:peptidoglycan hydrolase CwlO-like protein
MKEILLVIIPSIVAFFIGRRKANNDLCGERLDQLEKSLKVYNDIIADLTGKVEALKKEITNLEGKIQDLMNENRKLKKNQKQVSE